LELLESRVAPAAFSFSNPVIATNNPIGVTSHPPSTATSADEVEAGDDFLLTAPTSIQSATFTGLIPAGVSLSSISSVDVEIYRVFPQDSNPARTSGPNTNPAFSTSQVPTRVNSPADVARDSRDSATGQLTFTTMQLAASFTTNNSVITGINPKPNQRTGGEGAQTGQEIQFTVNFTTPFQLPADHYFFVPQVQLSGSPTFPFLWLAGVRPNPTFTPDLQAWIRNSNLDPDWLRIGTDIVGGSPAPTFNGAFTLTGQTSTPSTTLFIQSLYQDLLGRAPAPAEVSLWLTNFATLGQAGVADAILRSSESLTNIVGGLYQRLLGRSPVGLEAQSTVLAMRNGATVEQVIAGIAASAEFGLRANARVGGSNADNNFVQALYNTLLLRTASPGEIGGWVVNLPTLGRSGVAAQIAASAEYRGLVVSMNFYGGLLRRQGMPSSAEVAGWVNSSLDLLSIESMFAGSNEYFQVV
jgi:hypothetical protein